MVRAIAIRADVNIGAPEIVGNPRVKHDPKRGKRNQGVATNRTATAAWKRLVRQARALALDQGQTRCPRCRTQLDWEYSRRPNSAEVDHILPHAQGGADTIENTRILCRRCNQQLGGGMTKRQKPIIETTDLDTSPIW